MKDQIVVRGACLSQFTLERFDLSNWEILNGNKQRIDYALDLDEDESILCASEELNAYAANDFAREAVFPTQRKSLFRHTNVKAVIVDDYSELVDTMFVRKGSRRRFLACYHNVRRNQEFWQTYQATGRLCPDLLKDLYRRFLSKMCAAYENVPIYFLLFPSRFEQRPELLERHAAIRKALAEIAPEFPTMTIIDPMYVERHLVDASIYHFSEKTYDEVARRIAAQGLLKLKRRRLLDYVVCCKRSRWKLRKIVLFSLIAIIYWSKSRKTHLPIVLRCGFERRDARSLWLWR